MAIIYVLQHKWLSPVALSHSIYFFWGQQSLKMSFPGCRLLRPGKLLCGIKSAFLKIWTLFYLEYTDLRL